MNPNLNLILSLNLNQKLDRSQNPSPSPNQSLSPDQSQGHNLNQYLIRHMNFNRSLSLNLHMSLIPNLNLNLFLSSAKSKAESKHQICATWSCRTNSRRKNATKPDAAPRRKQTPASSAQGMLMPLNLLESLKLKPVREKLVCAQHLQCCCHVSLLNIYMTSSYVTYTYVS